MDQNGSKWVKMGQNGSKYGKVVKITQNLHYLGLGCVSEIIHYVSEIIQKVAGMVLSYKLLQKH